MFELFAIATFEILGLLVLRHGFKEYFAQLNGARKRAQLKKRLRAI